MNTRKRLLFPSRWAALLLVLSPVALLAVPTDPWIDPGYLYRVAITNLQPVDPAMPLNDFPVVIALTNIGWIKPYRSDGGDITFAGVDAMQLFHELEFYTNIGGKVSIQAWVCIPTFTNNTTIYMYWRNLGSSCYFKGSNTTFLLDGWLSSLGDPTNYNNVWDKDFMAVHHFSQYVPTGYSFAGYPRDSTANLNHVTSQGTNVTTNGLPGLGISSTLTGRGLMSSNRLYANTAGAQNVFGTALGRMNNQPGYPPYDRFYSNGSITHSLWVRFTDFPSNTVSNYNAGGPFPVFRHPVTLAWVSNLSGTQIGIFTLNRAWGFPNGADGYGGLRIEARNNNHRWFHRQQEQTGTGTYYVTNTNLGPVGGPFESWIKYDVTANNDTVANRVALQGYQNARLLRSNFVTPSAETGTTFGGITLMGANTEYTPGSSYGISPLGYYDEYRLSAIPRSSNWLINEYSNMVSTTNMSVFNGVDPTALENLLYAEIVNNSAFGSPTTGGAISLGLNVSTLFIPGRPPEFITNIVWTVTNTSTAWSWVTNFAYLSDTNDYSWVLSNLPSGYYKAQAAIVSSADDQGISKVYAFVVGSQPTYDLSRFRIVQTNTGFIFDLFSGLDGGLAQPTSVTFLRDERDYTGMVPLGNNRYLDTNDLFYDERRLYRFNISYSNQCFYSNAYYVTPGKATVTNVISAAGDDSNRMLINFELAVQFPAGNVAADTVFTIAHAPNIVGIDGYRQMIIDNGDGVYNNFAAPMTLRVKVRVAGGYVQVPGTTKKVVLSDASKMSLGYWDGFQWNSLPTTMTPYSNRIELVSAMSREGRIGILFNDGSGSTKQDFRLRNRMLVPGSSDSTYNTVLFAWDKTTAEKVTLSVYSQNGKVVYQKKDLLDPFWIWDGRDNNNLVLSPGVYLYAANVGASRVYRGSIIIMGQ